MSARFQATIRCLRLGRRLSLHAAGERCGLDHSLISRLECGQRNATRGNIAQLVGGYGLDQAQHDSLLVLAGFSPSDPLAAVADEPVVLALYRALRDETMPWERRAQLRALVGGALALVGEGDRG